jgi:hypothetical protein
VADEARIITPVEFFGPRPTITHTFADAKTRHPSQRRDEDESEAETEEAEHVHEALAHDTKAPKGAPAPD